MRPAIACGVVLALALVLVETLARTMLGLGTPALSVAHPTIEYMFKPNQHVYRFGNLQHYNAYGMRSTDFAPARTDAGELRVLVVGDSVINGGNLTDQAELGTELLRDELESLLRQPVSVANISAGSWGPPNQLAYLNEYGWFDADLVLFVESDHDAWDRPKFGPLNPNTHPTRSPSSAMAEGVTRYAPRLVRRVTGVKPAPAEQPVAEELAEDHEVVMAAMTEMVSQARERGIAVGMLLHRTRSELSAETPEGEQAFTDFAARLDVPVMHMADRFAECEAKGINAYRDNIHPSPQGQRILADAYRDMVARLLIDRSLAGPRSPFDGGTLASIEQLDQLSLTPTAVLH